MSDPKDVYLAGVGHVVGAVRHAARTQARADTQREELLTTQPVPGANPEAAQIGRVYMTQSRAMQADWLQLAARTASLLESAFNAGANSRALSPSDLRDAKAEIMAHLCKAMGPTMADIYEVGYVDGQSGRDAVALPLSTSKPEEV